MGPLTSIVEGVWGIVNDTASAVLDGVSEAVSSAAASEAA